MTAAALSRTKVSAAARSAAVSVVATAATGRKSPPPGRRWRPYQRAADKKIATLGLVILLWRRQTGKTEVLSTWALEEMLKHPGRTVTLASASLNVGGEVAIRAAKVFWEVLARIRARMAERAKNFDLGETAWNFDALREAFEAGKLEVKFTHPGGLVSRLKVLAPNPATARGFSGTVFLDEIGYIPDFKAVWDAVEPIASSDPTFRIIMCTTPPDDTAHYSHELLVPPQNSNFEEVNPEGHWYRSDAGIIVHRVDAWDADAAGAKLYHKETREPLSTDEHRAQSLDKDSWDRNYGLTLASTGTAACTLTALHFAQTRPESPRCLFIDVGTGDLPRNLRDLVGELTGDFTAGFDPATTEKKKSNPSAFALTGKVGNVHPVRVLVRWKTEDPNVAIAYVRELLQLARVKCLGIDASSEKYFAKLLRDAVHDLCQCDLLEGGANVTVGAVVMPTKTYLGNLVVNALTDGVLVLPTAREVRDDFRLVKKQAGRFDAEVDASGNHADTFDAVKNSLHGWNRTGVQFTSTLC